MIPFQVQLQAAESGPYGRKKRSRHNLDKPGFEWDSMSDFLLEASSFIFCDELRSYIVSIVFDTLARPASLQLSWHD